MGQRRRFFLLCSLAFLLACAGPLTAENTFCGGAKPLMVNDLGDSPKHFISENFETRWFRLGLESNRSYAIWTTVPFDHESDTASGQPPDTLLKVIESCANEDVIISNNDEFPEHEPRLHFRASRVKFRVPEDVNDTEVFIQVLGFSNIWDFSFFLYAVETTQFNPRWSTFGGFSTQWGFHNTTKASVTGTLRVMQTDGTVLATENFTIDPERVVFKTTTGLGIGPNQAGSAILTHNGPPGSIQADAFLVSSDLTVVVPAKFEPVREQQ